MIIRIPIKTSRGQNNRDAHWAQRARRARSERSAACLVVRAALRRPITLPTTIILTRLSSGTLDTDNLSGALKSVRDGVADAIGVDDGDPRVVWLYDQSRTKKGQWGVLVDIP